MYRSVAECYEGQSIFLTGGTGFLGKVWTVSGGVARLQNTLDPYVINYKTLATPQPSLLVILEKILYRCPGINKIYLLVRDKANATAQERVRDILEQPLFSRIKNEKPEALEKIKLIFGDISEPKLGISQEDEKLLTDKVTIVIHSAATVKMNDPLEFAVNVNVAGTENVLNLCKRTKNIKAFVYISTAYSNIDRDVIEEFVYPPPAPLDEVMRLVKAGISEDQEKELIRGRPNAYIFTKALAENLVAENHGAVPTIIIRPSIVTSSKSEPVGGWVDNWYGATSLMAAIGKGLMRVILSTPTNNLDFIPVDYVTNLIIVAAAKCERSEDVVVYNSSTSEVNPLSIGKLMDLIVADSCKYKWYEFLKPSIYITSYKWIMVLMTLILQKIPAYIADTYMWITGKKPRYTKIQSRISVVRDLLEHFTANQWQICAARTTALAGSLSPSDISTFPCDPKDIDWNEYIPTYCRGIRQYLFKMK